MDHDFLVFYREAASGLRHATVVRINHPPHDKPRGSIVEDLLYSQLAAREHVSIVINGYVELPGAPWNANAARELGLGDGIAYRLESTGDAWQIVP